MVPRGVGRDGADSEEHHVPTTIHRRCRSLIHGMPDQALRRLDVLRVLLRQRTLRAGELDRRVWVDRRDLLHLCVG